MAVYKRGKNGTHWNYYFRVRGVRYRGAIPEARTKWEAEQAELKIKGPEDNDAVHSGRAAAV